MRSWFAVLALAGCFSKPPRPGETSSDAAVPPPCDEPPLRDTFDDVFAPACGVGFPDGNPDSTLERAGGVLRASLTANVINDASCTWPSVDFELGTFVQVRRTLNDGGTFTLMQVTIEGVRVGISVLRENAPLLQLFDLAEGGDGVIASVPYDASAMQWWRLRPEAGHVAAEYSSDGRKWVRLGITTLTPAPSGDVEVSLNAGAYAALPDPGTAELDNFNVCPD